MADRDAVVVAVKAKDVAQTAAVSIATVSRVFNNRGNVTPQVRRRVLEVANELGYFSSFNSEIQKNTARQAVTIKECGFLIYNPTFSSQVNSGNNSWLAILRGVESEASKLNIKVVYRSINSLVENPHLLLNQIYEMRLNGILLVGPVEADVIGQLHTSALPIVLVDNYIPNLNLDSVLYNKLEGIRQGVEYLLGEGHRQIAFLAETASALGHTLYNAQQGLLGYQIALLKAGQSLDPGLIVTGSQSYEGGYAACQQLLAHKVKFSAIMCGNDLMALGALKALREAGCRVPEDVSLVGFEDLEATEYVNPPLTTVHIHKEALGASAFRRLLARATDLKARSELTMLNVELIKRASVAPPG